MKNFLFPTHDSRLAKKPYINFEDLFEWEDSDNDVFIPTNSIRKTLVDKYNIKYGTGISHIFGSKNKI